MIKKAKIQEYLFEVIAIFLGITISFYIDNWKKENEDLRLEENYFKGFREDIEKDIQNFDLSIQQGINIKLSAAKLLRFINNKNFDPDSFYYHTGQMLEVRYFIPNQNTYEEMKSSSHLKIIRSDSVRKHVIALYEFYKQINLVDKLTQKQQLDYYLPYITQRIDQEAWNKLAHGNSLAGEAGYCKDAEKLLQDVQFKNCIINIFTTFTQTISHYEEGKEKCKNLLEQLKKVEE